MRTEWHWVTVQDGNEEQPSTKMAVQCSLMTPHYPFTLEPVLKQLSSCIYEHLLKFGIKMHIGIGALPSKTEAMHFPPPRRLYSDTETLRLDVLDDSDILLASSILRRNSDTSVRSSVILWPHCRCKRTRPASAAFGFLKNISTNKHIDLKIKVRIHLALYLSILI
jgi:hypothetical protein